MVTELPARLIPFKFNSESATIASRKAAIVRRNTAMEFKKAVKAVECSEVTPDSFSEGQLIRVRKQLLLLNRYFVREHLRSSPRIEVIERITTSQDRLWTLERKLSTKQSEDKPKGSPEPQATRPKV